MPKIADQTAGRRLVFLALVCILAGPIAVQGQNHLRYEFGDYEVTRDSLIFTVLVSSDTAPVRLGTALILLNYDKGAFGQRILGQGKVHVALSDSFPCCSFTPYTALSVADNTDSRLAITLVYSPTGPAGFGTGLTLEGQVLYRLSVAIADNSRDTSIGFDAVGMENQTIQDDNQTTFDTIETGFDLNVPLYVRTLNQVESPGEEASQDAGTSIEVFPNPSSDYATIVIDLAERSRISLRMFDLAGRLVRQPVNRTFSSGKHHIRLRAVDLPDGLYLLRGSAGGKPFVEKLSIVR